MAADHYLLSSSDDRFFLRWPLNEPLGLAGRNVWRRYTLDIEHAKLKIKTTTKKNDCSFERLWSSCHPGRCVGVSILRTLSKKWKSKEYNKLIVCLTFCSASFSHVFLSRFHCNVVVYLARLHGRVGTCESSSRYYLYGTPLQRFHRSWQNAMLFRLFSPWCAHMCVRATLCAVIKFKLAVLFCEVFLVPSKTCVCTL